MQDASFEQDFSVHLSNLPRENMGLNHSMVCETIELSARLTHMRAPSWQTQIRVQVTRDIVTANDS